MPVVAMFVNGSGRNVQSLERTSDRDEMSNLYREPSIDASYQVSVHLAKQFLKRFLEIYQFETRIACCGHVCQRIGMKWAILIEDLS